MLTINLEKDVENRHYTFLSAKDWDNYYTD